ncbi:MAG TPA: Hsp20 family protein [Saprospiraceae bacterium]|nr:Hsp20 family protein [Saprospiraceae bacterium]
MNDKIDNKKITAKYEAGILHLSFPKLKEHVTKRQDIDIV